jgi:hypothetical protein
MYKVPLSHSQISKYSLCAKSYEYHYIKKIRPQVTSGALLFGSALDGALNLILSNKSKEEAYEEFEKLFTFNKINNKEYYLPTCEKVVYAKTDFDSDILSIEDSEVIKKTYKELFGEDLNDTLDLYKRLADNKNKLSTDEIKIYNLYNWLSLKQKGILMIDAYVTKVMPHLVRVLNIQEQIELKNENGEKVTGFVDLIAEHKDHGVVIFDNKTSARDYAEDSVLTSAQLSLYLHALESKYKTRKAGYIVLKKTINKNRIKICESCGFNGSGSKHKTCSNIIDGKRCNGQWKETISPEVDVQIIVDKIPEQTENIVIENIDTVNEAIKARLFPRNLNSCTNYWGGLCPYINLCYKNKMEGLEYVKKE